MNHRINVTAPVASHSPIVGRQTDLPTELSGHSLVEDFMASMPERYRQEFGRASARQHARIAAARGRHRIHADLFSGKNAIGPGICVVGADAPGLLSVISSALMLEGFDITRADAYTRRAACGEYEAVDLFWVRRSSKPEQDAALGEADATAVRATLRELLSNGIARQRLTTALPATSPGTSETSVRFRDLRGVPWLTLELESNDRPGLLAVVTAALTAAGVTIVASRIRTHGLRVHDYFDIIGADGRHPTGTGMQRIQLAVLTAVDGPSRGA